MFKIRDSLYKEIVAFCKLNKIEDTDLFCNNLLEKAFVTEKYGDKPIVKKTPIVVTEIIEEKPRVEEKIITSPPIKTIKETKDNYKVYDNF